MLYKFSKAFSRSIWKHGWPHPHEIYFALDCRPSEQESSQLIRPIKANQLTNQLIIQVNHTWHTWNHYKTDLQGTRRRRRDQPAALHDVLRAHLVLVTMAEVSPRLPASYRSATACHGCAHWQQPPSPRHPSSAFLLLGATWTRCDDRSAHTQLSARRANKGEGKKIHEHGRSLSVLKLVFTLLKLKKSVFVSVCVIQYQSERGVQTHSAMTGSSLLVS